MVGKVISVRVSDRALGLERITVGVRVGENKGWH